MPSRKTNARFRSRFAHVEKKMETGASLERMEYLWQEAKRLEH